MNRSQLALVTALFLVACKPPTSEDQGPSSISESQHSASEAEIEAAGDALGGTLAGRHVIILVLDSLHAAHLSSYGYERPTSPHIDSIAENGVRFVDAHSQTSWTLSSAVSILTSVPQEEHGVKFVEDVLSEEFELLPRLFQDSGYRTAALSQNGCVRPVVGLGRAADSFLMYPRGEEGTRALFDRLLALVENAPVEGKPAPDEGPLFAYAHVLPPHMPYFPPEGHAGLFSDANYEGPVDGDFMSCMALTQNASPPDHPDAVQLCALYDEFIHWIDTEVGRFRAELEARFGADSFLLVFSSDHGEAFQQHGKQGHNADVYQEMVHVPLIFEAPGADFGPSVSDEPVSLLDLGPTLTALCGLREPAHTHRGRDLSPALAGFEPEWDRTLFLSSRYRHNPKQKRHWAVRHGPWKYLKRGDRRELFHLDRDPGEQANLIEDEPELAAGLDRRLEAWRKAYASRINPLSGAAPVPEELDAELRAIGYVGDDDD